MDQASFTPDGRTVLTASNDNTARLWDAQSGKELLRLAHGGLLNMVNAVSFNPDGRTVATACATGRPACGTPRAAKNCYG